MGESPYPGKSVHQVIEFISDGNRMAKTKCIPKSVYEIMLKCWYDNPEDRSTFVDLQSQIRALINLSEDVSYHKS